MVDPREWTPTARSARGDASRSMLIFWIRYLAATHWKMRHVGELGTRTHSNFSLLNVTYGLQPLTAASYRQSCRKVRFV